MRGKIALWLFGLLILLASVIGALISFNVPLGFLESLPKDAYIYFIIAGVLAIIEIILGFSNQTY